MAEVTLPDMSLQWAQSGDILQPSNAKIQSGWAAEIPPRQWFNWLDNRQDQAITHMVQHGISVWSSTIEYRAGKSYVQGSDGNIYVAITTNTNQNPVLDISEINWASITKGGFAVFTTSGTSSWTVPTILKLGLIKPIVTVIGGGGSGATLGAGSHSTGGASGGSWKGRIDLTGVSSISITVGAGGIARTVGGQDGANGTASSFGAFVSCGGGQGGLRSGSLPPGGSVTTSITGGILVNGQQGGISVLSATGGVKYGGQGGSTILGSGGQISSSSGTPTGFGSGSGGGAVNDSLAGRDGLVSIEW